MKNRIFSLLLTLAMALTVIIVPLPKPQPIPDGLDTSAGNSDLPNCDGDEKDFDS